MTTLPLQCACGQLRGTLDATAQPGARADCYCDDCQAYARHLGSPGITNAHGGTSVVQTWPARIHLTEGVDQLALVRLSAKGLHRWYAGCCRTPVANTTGSARAPFAGLIRQVIVTEEDLLDGLFGPAHGVQGRFARGGCPPGAVPSATVSILVAATGILARGWWAGAHTPSPFFRPDGTTVIPARVLTVEERAAAYAR